MAHHLTIRAIADTKAQALGHALRVLALVADRPHAPGWTTSSNTGSAEATPTDPDDIEGPAPTPAERAALARQLDQVAPEAPDKFALMFGHASPQSSISSPASYYLAGLRDLLSASLLHLLHHAGAAGLTVALVRDSLRGAEHAAIFDAFQRLHRAGLATAPQRHTGRGRPYSWTITPAGSHVVTRPFSPALTLQPPLTTGH